MNRPHLGPLRQPAPGCSRRGGQRRAALSGGVRLANAGGEVILNQVGGGGGDGRRKERGRDTREKTRREVP